MTKRKTPGNVAPNEVRPPAGHPENPVDGGDLGVGPLTSAARGVADALPGGPWCWREVRHGVVCALPQGHDGDCREGQLFGIADSYRAPALSAERETIEPPPPVEVACPFCGGVARVVGAEAAERGDAQGRVRCDDCGALGPDRLGDDAVTAWNDRSGPRGGA